ncbi:hypothetical protein [Actinocorallia longicatena]|uniref:hypothetical protein n=1 Tax=Actinocorallia longicatena TaxID=111803 RepID=UPI0031DADFB2
MLPQADDAVSWTPQIPGGEPWPPEPWQPDATGQRPSWRYDPDDPQPTDATPRHPWAEQPVQETEQEAPRAFERPADPDRPWAEPPAEADERPWPAPPERPRAFEQPADPERPWAEPPAEAVRTRSEQPAERPQAAQPAEQPVERPWAEQPDERPWAARPDENLWAEQPPAARSEQPWSAPPADPDRPWAEQPGEPAWGARPAEPAWGAEQERPWANQPAEQERPWAEQAWNPQRGGGRQSAWDDSGSGHQPPRRPEGGEQWLPDDGPRWRGPLIAGLVAALLTALIVVGYVFWSKSDDDGGVAVQLPSAQPTGKTTAKSSAPEPDDSEDPAQEPSGDAKSQATAVDGVLSDMTASRKKLESITYNCSDKSGDISTFKTAVSEREAQLGDVDDLNLDALDGGDDLKAALKDALQASIDANGEAIKFLRDEGGCDGDAAERLQEWNDKAGKAKTKFLGLWNPVAEAQGLPERTREEI